jgi:hypothetical protein
MTVFEFAFDETIVVGTSVNCQASNNIGPIMLFKNTLLIVPLLDILLLARCCLTCHHRCYS